MIVKTFDNGWGSQWSWKQMENQVVTDMLRPLADDHTATVVINSVWPDECIDCAVCVP